ncbi:MAG: tRNA uridine-5-carboxymethylaminomethyl(34) synthesis enzyme MnmG [Bacilli bacterium]|nr:tRNA uridine-5-carboxymethylaminomethyl(34) synthesis enzyme MnmG [Bacilli bacterium]MDD3895717.1 tRNA uridine-5-carboxymethylaminomethyl(34) synthesis enzyme MnmG [Bacilli bacterium]MDD4407467.1 tRNA uridine-5-carboxymethylaminomethyl(34) synthesis enzyme MnmG [Bacilli bacterium]
MKNKYDIIVVGGGHAGCEASYVASKLNFNVALITSNINNIADMPCNPSIGGTAKGIVVREIDALGGLMGKIADRSHFQIKMLNNSKGPAVRSLRAQADKKIYPQEMLKELKKLKNLTIIEAMVEDIIVNDNTITGIILENNKVINCKSLILTTGTYLKSHVLVGSEIKKEGPHGERRSLNLSDNLKKRGFEILRLKTGTPQRIEKNSIDYSNLKPEYGDLTPLTFSFDNPPLYDINNQELCYVTYTSPETHKIINDNLEKSAMYSGNVKGVGARYCPSIEDKIVRFADKERHQLFLEPESKFTNEIYIQGFSTSMPYDVQEKLVHSLPGLEKAKILKYAYAIEYDAINPLHLKPSLETKIINNLYTAGQINGTSGYEEAAGQGLIAGINASLKLQNKEPLILKRNESYIGVLIDDLVTKGTIEPYRLLTSRAEYRLILRHDNADLRLRKYGYEIGLINKIQYNKLIKKENSINDLINELKIKRLSKKNIPLNVLDKIKEKQLTSGYSLYELIKRPEFKIIDFINNKLINSKYSNDIIETTEFLIKYEGYINKTYKDIKRLLKLEEKQIPKDIDYDKVKNIATEGRQKLKQIKPLTIAQATRISGVNPADISMLIIYLKKEYSNNE